MRLLLIPSLLLCGLLVSSPAKAQSFLGKNARTWQAELEAESEAGRRNAAYALGKLGSHAAPAVPVLARRLAEENKAKVREAIAFALGEIARESLAGAADPNLLPALIKALKDDEPLVRRSAAYALGNLGRDAEPARDALEAALADAKAEVRQNVAWALGKLGASGVPALRKALGDGDPLVKRDAANSLAGIEIAAVRPALGELLKLCGENNSEVRRSALAALVRIVGPEDTGAAASIRQALLDPDFEVRCNAALVLSNIGGKEAKAGLDVLLGALKKENVELRRQAAAAIHSIGPDAEKAVPALIQALRDPDEETRGNAALALGGIGQAAEKAVPALVELIASIKEHSKTRVNAAVALSKIGDVQAAVNAVPTLLAVLADPRQDPHVRERIVWALRVHKAGLRKMGVFPTLTKVMKEEARDENRMLRYDCAYMLGALQGPEVPPATMNVLLEFLRDDTIQIFVGVGTKVKGVIEKDPGKAESKDLGQGDGRVMAIQALQQIGRARILERNDIVNQLRALAANKSLNPDLRDKTQKLLQTIGK
jgi:HEAT repeat protein